MYSKAKVKSNGDKASLLVVSDHSGQEVYQMFA
jgi:hypothetical protein